MKPCTIYIFIYSVLRKQIKNKKNEKEENVIIYGIWQYIHISKSQNATTMEIPPREETQTSICRSL